MVIGNAKYEKAADLDNPINDAEKISKALRFQGFEVDMALDLNRAEMYDSLRRFRTKADSAAFALVYYAGHGIEVAGTNYLVPVDAELLEERDAGVELITVETILGQISGASQLKMVVLDACRNNPFVAEMKRKNTGRNISRGLGKIETDEADTLIAYAAAAGEITPDGVSGGNSPFTAAFLKALESTPKDVRRMLGTVRDEMRVSVPGATPFVYNSLGGGEYVINPNSEGPDGQVASIPALPSQPRDSDELSMVADFLVANQASTLSDWDAFLLKYRAYQSSSVYSLAVRNRSLIVGNDTPGTPVVEASRSAPSFDAPETKRDAVRMLQNYLRARGCFRSYVDGFYGPRTARGLARYAAKSGGVFQLPARPGLQELLPVLRKITPDTKTQCVIPRVAAATANRTRKTAPAGTTRSATTTRPSVKPAAEPNVSRCVVFEGQKFCE